MSFYGAVGPVDVGEIEVASHLPHTVASNMVMVSHALNHSATDAVLYLGRNEILNTKNNEFNSAAIFPVWHELSMLRRGQINVAGIRRRQET